MQLVIPPWQVPRSLSVVVCAYTDERWNLLSSCVESLLAQTHRPDQVIVVVDHNEALLERCRASLGPEVECMSNNGRRGLSGARNSGVAAAHGEVVAFVDDDAVPRADWAQLLMHTYEPLTAGVGGTARPVWERLLLRQTTTRTSRIWRHEWPSATPTCAISRCGTS